MPGPAAEDALIARAVREAQADLDKGDVRAADQRVFFFNGEGKTHRALAALLAKIAVRQPAGAAKAGGRPVARPAKAG